MNNTKYSKAELEQQRLQALSRLIDSVKSLNSKTLTMESKLGITTNDDLAQQLQEIMIEISNLSQYRITGGNVYISQTTPINPKPNDIWFDLNLIRR